MHQRLSALLVVLVVPTAFASDQTTFFEKNIRPVLAERCYQCHSSQTVASGGLQLDSRATLLQGGKSGPAVVPGKPNDSCF